MSTSQSGRLTNYLFYIGHITHLSTCLFLGYMLILFVIGAGEMEQILFNVIPMGIWQGKVK